MANGIETRDRDALLAAFSGSETGHSLSAPAPSFAAPAERMFGAQQVAVYRDEAKVLQKLKVLAAAAGDDWYYRFPVKNNKTGQTDWIEGPSIKLANDLSRLYGNCEIDTRVTDLGDSWVIYSRFIDYESGYALTRPFQQRKNASKMGGDEGRRLDIAFQIGVSKSNRNVVVNALQTFADFAFEEAKNSLVDKIGKNIAGYRDRVVKALENQPGGMLPRAEAVQGRKAKDWLVGDVAQVIAIMKAINDGMATWDESFPPLAGDTDAPQVTSGPAKAERKPTVRDFAAEKRETAAQAGADPETGEIPDKKAEAIQAPAPASAAPKEAEPEPDRSEPDEGPEDFDDDPLLAKARSKALEGSKRFRLWLANLSPIDEANLAPHIATLRKAAKDADPKATEGQS